MPVYHYLHEQHKALVPKLDKVFGSMHQAGELEMIRNRVIQEMLQQARMQ